MEYSSSEVEVEDFNTFYSNYQQLKPSTRIIESRTVNVSFVCQTCTVSQY